MAASAQHVGAVPPPPGRMANLINPPDHKVGTVVLHFICLGVATIFLAFRLFTRAHIHKTFGADDYLCIIGYCCAVVFSALLIWGQTQGIGRHIWDVTYENLETLLKALTIAEYFYLMAAAFIKLSCLCFYYRVFSPKTQVRLLIWGGIGFISVAYTIILFTTIFECWPVAKSWNVAIQGHCLPPKGLPYASGAINVFSDLYVLILPIPVIWNLNMSWRRKLRTGALFCLGTFVCVTSIIRLEETHILYENEDRTWELFYISIWSVLEIDIGVLCACLLAFPSFVQYCRNKGQMSLTSNERFDKSDSHALSRMTRSTGFRGEIHRSDNSLIAHK